MPTDLVFHRVGPNPPVRMACMYCGGPATVKVEKRVRNPEQDPEESGPPRDSPDINGTTGGGTLGAIVACIFLAIMLWQFVRWLAKKANPPRRPDLPPLVPDHTVVTVTACDRHRRYWPFAAKVWGAAVVVFLGALALAWVGSQSRGESVWGSLFMVLPAVALFVGIIVMSWVFQYFPRVRVDDVRRETVRLVGISPKYFTAPRRNAAP